MAVALLDSRQEALTKKGNNMQNLKLTIVGGLLAGAFIFLPVSGMADDHGKLHVPPGHLPPAGKCRIWYPGTPPGHQPPPGDCRTLSRQLPRGAWLVSRDRTWRYDERPDYYYYRRPPVYYGRPDWHDDDRYYRGGYDGRSYSRKNETRKDIQDVREAHKNVQQNRDQLEKNREELKKDRVELKKDIRSKASRTEIRQDRQEIREDVQKIHGSRKDVRQSQNKLEAARGELNHDLRRK
jgi:hypothetical protein